MAIEISAELIFWWVIGWTSPGIIIAGYISTIKCKNKDSDYWYGIIAIIPCWPWFIAFLKNDFAENERNRYEDLYEKYEERFGKTPDLKIIELLRSQAKLSFLREVENLRDSTHII